MNIQFMTDEKNGVPRGTKDWKGRDEYYYVPDFDEMIRNARCPEEVEAINDARDMIENKRIFEGFTFRIVFMAKVPGHNFKTGEWGVCWQMLQHPWYEIDGVRMSKEYMLKDIENMIRSMQKDNPEVTA